jgi:hypothetical protein
VPPPVVVDVAAAGQVEEAVVVDVVAADEYWIENDWRRLTKDADWKTSLVDIQTELDTELEKKNKR